MNYTSYSMPSSKQSKKSVSLQQPSKGQPSSSLDHKMDSLQSTITQFLPSQSTSTNQPSLSTATSAPKQGRERASSFTSNTSNHKGPGSVGSNQGQKTHQKVNEALMIPSLRDSAPEDWDIDQVGDWLDAMDFSKDRDTFRGKLLPLLLSKKVLPTSVSSNLPMCVDD
jgi:hypothetical protein